MQIRPISPIPLHSLCISHLHKWLQDNVADKPKVILHKALKYIEYIQLAYKRDFTIYLCKLRLTISLLVFISQVSG